MDRPALAIRLIDPSLPLPTYHSERAAGIDLYCRTELAVPAHSYAYAPLNVAIKFPEGYWGLMAARSSLHKKGLTLLNGVGIFDPDFCGDNDEYQAVLYNFTDSTVTVPKGERIAQVVPLPVEQFAILRKDRLGDTDRGGFGTTG